MPKISYLCLLGCLNVGATHPAQPAAVIVVMVTKLPKFCPQTLLGGGMPIPTEESFDEESVMPTAAAVKDKFCAKKSLT